MSGHFCSFIWRVRAFNKLNHVPKDDMVDSSAGMLSQVLYLCWVVIAQSWVSQGTSDPGTADISDAPLLEPAADQQQPINWGGDVDYLPFFFGVAVRASRPGWRHLPPQSIQSQCTGPLLQLSQE